jgi:3-oxoadipate enol-lactonase
MTDDGRREPLVLLHSLAMDGRMWSRVVTRLQDRFDCIALDVRGHGHAAWDGHPFTIDDLADDLLEALDRRELPQPHLLGLSMGGSVALTFAGRHPERVRSLLLADTTAWYGPGAEEAWEERARTALERPRPDLLDFQLPRWFTERFRADEPDEVRRIVDIFLACDSRVHAEACRALGGMDSRGLLGHITAPTLVLAGEEDYATPPAMGRAIADAVPGARLLVVPEVSHLSLIERPELADELAAHMASVTRA